MFKKIIFFAAALSMILYTCLPAAAYGAASLYSTQKTYSVSKNNIKAWGYIPEIKNLTNPIFQYKLNSSIVSACDEYVSNAAVSKIKNLKLNYDVVVDNNIISAIIYITNTANSTSDILSFVINKEINAYVGINNILGSNGVSYANKVVENKIKNDSSVKYYGSWQISSEQPFYVKGGNVIVMFGAGKICSPSQGVKSYVIPSQNISNYIVKPVNYYTKPNYNVKMIPLREVVESFGYSVSWNNSTGSITVSKNGFYTTLKPGRNSYSKGSLSPRQLEFAPEIKNGITYVPISFFGEILDLLFASDSNANVTISDYSI